MKLLIILITSFALALFSTLTICLAPNINKYGEDWQNLNCQKKSDDIEITYGSLHYISPEEKKIINEIKTKEVNRCRRKKAMNDLEYPFLFISIATGVICSIVGLFAKLGFGNIDKKKLGLIFGICGVICFILSFIYSIFSMYIFTNDRKEDTYVKYDNGADYKWDNTKNRYLKAYETDNLNNSYLQFVKYNELGKKQYNYNSEFLKDSYDVSSEFYNCKGITDISTKMKRATNNNYCEYAWESIEINKEIINKYLYDRWIATIIFGFFATVCSIPFSAFGFLLFKEENPNPN